MTYYQPQLQVQLQQPQYTPSLDLYTGTQIHNNHEQRTVVDVIDDGCVDANVNDNVNANDNENDEVLKNLSIWFISTLKRRKKKMNKHKLRKRRKLLRLKSKK